MRNIKMPKIHQFRQVVREVDHLAKFIGLDDKGQPVYDNTITKPTIIFHGTVKLHGTNGSVCLFGDEIYAQKKSGKITIEKDNFGFAFFVESNKQSFKNILQTIFERAGLDKEKHILTYYGEWAGSGIQKGVAISEIDKAFYGFGCKVSPRVEDEFDSYWLTHEFFGDLEDKDNRIYNLHQFPTYEVMVDFENPVYAQKAFEDFTLAVEKECPVAKEFGVSGIGEGIVFTADYKGQRLIHKCKGDKHASSKVKKVASVDVEKMNSIMEFVDYASTTARFDQAMGEVFKDTEPTIKMMGDLIRWVVKDIHSEELDTMKENNLEPKDVNKYLSANVRKRFMYWLDNEAGLK